MVQLLPWWSSLAPLHQSELLKSSLNNLGRNWFFGIALCRHYHSTMFMVRDRHWIIYGHKKCSSSRDLRAEMGIVERKFCVVNSNPENLNGKVFMAAVGSIVARAAFIFDIFFLNRTMCSFGLVWGYKTSIICIHSPVALQGVTVLPIMWHPEKSFAPHLLKPRKSRDVDVEFI